MSEMKTLNGYEIVDEWARDEIMRIKDESDEVTDSKYFDIDYDGIVSLKPEYRGRSTDDKYTYAISDNGIGVDGSKINELPERIVIPDVIDDTAVSGFQAGMFLYNFQVKEIVFPDSIGELPAYFCCDAKYLRSIENTEHIKKLGERAMKNTRIKKALFPNLESAETQALCQCKFLYTLDIGNKLEVIPPYFAYGNMKLSRINGGASVTTIGENAFYNTFNLKNAPFLSNNKLASIGKLAFANSRIQFDWGTLTNCTFGTNATPIADNTVDYWSGYSPVACENRLVSMLNQWNPEWAEETYGTTNLKYQQGCSAISILHIHSALANKPYASPFEFEADIEQTDASLLGLKPSTISNAVSIFKGLGYSTTYYSATITADFYAELCEALAQGAYVYAQMTTSSNVNGGHVVVLYGINDIGEVLVLDSDTGVDLVNVYDAGLTYQIPIQNITGPSSDFVIVRKEA